jgi:serpin B
VRSDQDPPLKARPHEPVRLDPPRRPDACMMPAMARLRGYRILLVALSAFGLAGCPARPTKVVDGAAGQESEAAVRNKARQRELVKLFAEACNDGDARACSRLDDLYKERRDLSKDRSGTRFALDLYSQLSSQKGNLFFSPFSIYSALAMTYGGAAGETARQMAQVLRIDTSAPALHAALGRSMLALNEGGKRGGYSLSIANALWAQRGAGLLASFVELVRKTYNAGIEQVDFNQDAEGVRGLINSWVEKKTAHKIQDLIAPGILTALTRLVLVNAVYFKASWEIPFKERWTQTESFKVTLGAEVKAPLMSNTDVFDYFEDQNLQVLSMSYKDSDLSMVAVLPRKTDGLPKLEKTLSTEIVETWLRSLRPREVEVYLPKFKMTQAFSLSNLLKAMGMKDAFDESAADFSGMNGRRPPDEEALHVSEVLHKAFVEVNEWGTEAAAASAIAMMKTGGMPPPPPVFRADHPFLFLIRDDKSGSILFLGRVTDPTKS